MRRAASIFCLVWVLSAISALLLLPCLAAASTGEAQAAEAADVWTTVQLTNDSQNQYRPWIGGDAVVWSAFDGQDWGVYLLDLKSGITKKLSDKTVADEPSLYTITDGEHVVWHAFDGYRFEVFLYDIAAGTTTKTANNGEFDDVWPYVDSGHVVWMRCTRGDYTSNSSEIMLYDIATGATTQITDNALRDEWPSIYGNVVTWDCVEWGARYAIHTYDITTGVDTVVVPEGFNMIPRLDEDYLVWHFSDGDHEVGVMDRATNTLVFRTDNNWGDDWTDIGEGLVAWYGSDGADREIFVHDMNTGITTQLTDNTVDDTYASVSEGRVVWQQWDGNDWEIMLATRAPNRAPSVTVPPNATIDEGGIFTGLGSFTDYDSTAWTATVDYGDGSGVQTLVLALDKTFSLSHAYGKEGAYVVEVSVSDGDGGTATASFRITVNNVAPQIALLGPATASEGVLFTQLITFTDPGTEAWKAKVNYGDRSTQSFSIGPERSFPLSHTYLDNGVYTVSIEVTDDVGAKSTASFKVTVLNVAPSVFAGADAAIKITGTFTQKGYFTDPGKDKWRATVSWGDGRKGTLTLKSDKSFTLSHRYLRPGTYTVTVTITDDDGGVGTDTAVVHVMWPWER